MVDALAKAAVEAASAGREVSLAGTFDTEDWTSAAIFGPYADSDTARETLGFAWDLNKASPWTNSEGGAVLVLIRSDEVVAWAAVPSSRVQLHCITEGPYDRADATFSALLDSDGVPILRLDPTRC